MERKRSSFSNTMRINLLPDVGQEVPEVRTGGNIRDLSGKTEVVRTERPYRDFLESIYDAAIIADDAGSVLEYNGRAVAFLKYAPNALSGLHLWDIIAGADQKIMEVILENLAAERFTLIQAFCLCSDGSYFPAEIAVSRIRQNEQRFCLMIRDITVRREAEEQLIIEHNALKNAGNGIVITDPVGTVSYANPSFYALLGRDPKDASAVLRGENLFGLSEGKELRALLESVLETRGSQSGELVLVRKKGSLPVEATVAANLNSEGDLVGAVFSFADLTDRKVAESARKEAEQQRVMLESMGTACHHLGQPATVLMTSMGLLRKRVGTEPEAAELLDRCDEMCARLGETLRQMQKLTKYRTRRYTDEGLAAILSLDES